MRLKAIHTIKHSGEEFLPGSVFEIGDKKGAERLIKLGSAEESGAPLTGPGSKVEDLTPTMPAPPAPGGQTKKP